MSNLIRRLSKTLSNSEEPSSRRKSSSASAPSPDYTAPGVRDYKLAIDPSEFQGRRESVTSQMADAAAAELMKAKTGEEVEVSDGKIWGARDWRKGVRKGSQ